MNHKGGSRSFNCLHFQLSSVCLNYVIAQTQSQASSLPGWFGGEERLENFISDFFGDAGAVIFNGDLDSGAVFSR